VKKGSTVLFKIDGSSEMRLMVNDCNGSGFGYNVQNPRSSV
jgi:hypothetical protein